ncbi:hypothetical protein FOCC_FOCC015263, partial [Frankliniella occidentalis]
MASHLYERHVAGHALQHVCRHCEKRFSIASNLRRHVDRVHPQGPLLKCSRCSYSTKIKDRMKKHAASSHRDGRQRVCEECADSFRTLGAYLVHRRQHARARQNNGSTQSFRCPHCRAMFHARLARTAHMSHCGRRRRPTQHGRGAEEDEWESEFALDGAATIHKMPVRGNEETKDTSIALIAYKEKMLQKITELARELKGLKFWVTVRVGATRETAGGLEEEEKFLRSQNHIVLAGETGERQLESAILQTVESGDNIIAQGSSWQITAVYFIEMSVVEYAPLAARSYIPLPKALRNSKLGIINIKNKNDAECFRNFMDYTVLYCVCDCALLSDIFSSYRLTTYETFQLEPCKFVSGASLSFACALKKTRLRIENITCPDQFSYLERSLRGGQAFISARYLKANNEFCEDYDPDKPKTFLSVFDLTALYSGVMCQSLPCGEYEWVDERQFDLENMKEDDEYGYYWEVDASYPPHLHERHRDFPLAPEKLHITEDMLSPAQKRLLAVAGRKLPKK